MTNYEVLVDNFTFEGAAHAKGSVISIDTTKGAALVSQGKLAVSPRS